MQQSTKQKGTNKKRKEKEIGYNQYTNTVN